MRWRRWRQALADDVVVAEVVEQGSGLGLLPSWSMEMRQSSKPAVVKELQIVLLLRRQQRRFRASDRTQKRPDMLHVAAVVVAAAVAVMPQCKGLSTGLPPDQTAVAAEAEV